MANPRCNLVSLQCFTCGKIWNGVAWLQERRHLSGEAYAQGLCETCKALLEEGKPKDLQGKA